jgi:hypothetical protein
MSPELIFFAIRSLIRVGTAARDAYEQKVRDGDFAMPPLPVPAVYPEERIILFFSKKRGPYHQLTAEGGALSKYWNAAEDTNLDTDEAREALLAYADLLRREKTLQTATNKGDDIDWRALRWSDEEAVDMLPQWGKGQGPINPWARIGLALADVALDYINTTPKSIGLEGNAEVLVKAFTGNLRVLLPNPDNVARAYFVERLGVALLQSGLKSIADNAAAVTDSAALQAMIGNISKPLVDLFEGADAAEKLTWLNIRDTILPKMVQAGIETLAEHQKAFLGRKFDPDNLAGAMTKAFLEGLVKTGLTGLGKMESWVPVYKSLLGVIATRPQLITGAGAEVFFQELLANVAKQMKDLPVPPPFRGGGEVDLLQAVVDALGKDVPWIKDERWDETVVAVVVQVAEGLRSGTGVAGLRDRARMTAILQIVLGTISRTPGIVLGDSSSKEIQAIVGVIAQAMSTDSNLLLSGPDWETIAAVAAAEAARNPGRLFKIDDATPEAQLALKMIQAILNKTAADLAAARRNGAVLFGATLATAITETLKVAAGNATKAFSNDKQLEALVASLNALAESKDPALAAAGAEEWLWLFRKLVAGVLDGGKADYTPKELSDMLYGKAKS